MPEFVDKAFTGTDGTEWLIGVSDDPGVELPGYAVGGPIEPTGVDADHPPVWLTRCLYEDLGIAAVIKVSSPNLQ